MRRRRVVILVVLAVYTTMLATIAGCGLTDRLLLWPQKGSIDTGGATRLALPLRDSEIEVWRARRGTPRAYVLRFYGNADRADGWVASEVASLPFDAEMWGVNYPGFGGSGGSASLRGVAESALVAYDAMRAQSNGKPIFVFGTSMGTTAALHIAAQRDPFGVLLHNPPPLAPLIRGRYGWWNLWLLALPVSLGVPSDLDSLANAAIASAPAIFVLSAEDQIVPPPYARMVRDAYRGPKQTFELPGASHNDPIPDEVQRKINEALLQMLGAR